MCREDIPDADSDIIDEIAIALSTDSAMELPAEKTAREKHRNSQIQSLRNCLMLCLESLPTSLNVIRDRITLPLLLIKLECRMC